MKYPTSYYTKLVTHESQINEALADHGLFYKLDERSMFDKFSSITVITDDKILLEKGDINKGLDIITSYVNIDDIS